MIEIEKDVPLPTRGDRVGATRKYPWIEMEVGDSFLVLGRGDMYAQASRAGAAYRRKFAVRKNPVGGGVRVWRVE